MSSSVPAPRRRVMLWVYLVGLTQVLIASGSVFLVHRLLQRAPWEHEPVRARGLISTFAVFLDDKPRLERALARLPDTIMTFRDVDGKLIASTADAFPALSSAQLERLHHEPWLALPTRGPMPISVMPILVDGKRTAHGMSQRRPTPYPLPSSKFPLSVAIALIGAAGVAFAFGRSLVRPLTRLAAAARAFGDGDLEARSGITRNDELGEVARTFDEMADRVNAL